jgi:hypothetical protein
MLLWLPTLISSSNSSQPFLLPWIQMESSPSSRDVWSIAVKIDFHLVTRILTFVAPCIRNLQTHFLTCEPRKKAWWGWVSSDYSVSSKCSSKIILESEGRFPFINCSTNINLIITKLQSFENILWFFLTVCCVCVCVCVHVIPSVKWCMFVLADVKNLCTHLMHLFSLNIWSPPPQCDMVHKLKLTNSFTNILPYYASIVF